MVVASDGTNDMDLKPPLVTPAFLKQTRRVCDYTISMGSILLCQFSMTLQGPYLLPYAQAHGVSASMASIILALQPFAVVIIQPIATYLGNAVGYRQASAIGLAVGGAAMALFAYAPFLMPYGRPLSVLLTIAATVAGFGEGVVDTCTTALAAQVFPDVMGQVMGHVETFIGVGSVLGPLVGGCVYDFGGFAAPAALISALMFFTAAAMSVKLCQMHQPNSLGSLSQPLAEENLAESPPEVIVENPSCSADKKVFLAVAIGQMFAGFIAGALMPVASDYYATKMSWSMSFIGLIFGGFGVAYVLAAVAAGVLCDRRPGNDRKVYVSGLFLSALGLALTTLPSPTASACSVVLIGATSACIAVPVLSLLSQSAPPDHNEGFVASVLTAGYTAGLGAGPLLTVPLYGAFGYHHTMWVAATIVGVASLVIAGIVLTWPLPSMVSDSV
mmetsp:Transcript_56440/g.157319  ORF Transcript_56440/g.157319 Transcript_56440/m.157319 type:complete len:444 (-) Transcript_56440:38-1369(-)